MLVSLGVWCGLQFVTVWTWGFIYFTLIALRFVVVWCVLVLCGYCWWLACFSWDCVLLGPGDSFCLIDFVVLMFGVHLRVGFGDVVDFVLWL